MSLVIREARPGDAAVVVELIHGLATYERLAGECEATPELVVEALFGPAPRAFCEIAEWDGAPVGMALWFYSFSTFRCRHGIYLEDLFVRPEARGKGVGKALMARLAARCVEEGLPRFEWSVLDWNVDAIGFYEGMGARVMHDWRVCRLEGEAMARLAGTAQ